MAGPGICTEVLDMQALAETLHRFYDLFNAEYFSGALPLSLITFKTESGEVYENR